jgi:hypothetical protein
MIPMTERQLTTLLEIADVVNGKEIVEGLCTCCEERRYMYVNGAMVNSKDCQYNEKMKKYLDHYLLTCLSCKNTRMYDIKQLEEMRR